MTRWLLLALLLISAPAQALEWTYLSMDGEWGFCIESDPIHDRIFVGTVEGFHYLDIPSGEWTNRDWDDWIGRQVWSVQWHPAMENRVITGRENGFFKGYIELSEDLGATEDLVHMSMGGPIMDLAEDGAYFYACGWPDVAPGEFLRSADGGETWELLGGHGHFAMTAMDVGFVGELYLVGDNRVMRSWDAGESWEFVGGGLPTGEVTRAISKAYDGGDIITDLSHFVGTDSGIYFADAVNAWEQRLDIGCRSIVTYGGAYLLRTDDVAAVTVDGRVFISTSYGETWTDETGNLPTDAIDIAYSPYDDALYVVTAFSGVYYVPDVITAASETPSARLALSAWPNPFNPKTRLSFTLPAAARVRLDIFDASGRRVDTLLNEERAAGSHEVSWRAEGLASGVYLARLTWGDRTLSERLVLLK